MAAVATCEVKEPWVFQGKQDDIKDSIAEAVEQARRARQARCDAEGRMRQEAYYDQDSVTTAQDGDMWDSWYGGGGGGAGGGDWQNFTAVDEGMYGKAYSGADDFGDWHQWMSDQGYMADGFNHQSGAHKGSASGILVSVCRRRGIPLPPHSPAAVYRRCLKDVLTSPGVLPRSQDMLTPLERLPAMSTSSSRKVRRNVDFAGEAATRNHGKATTTLMLRSMPRNMTRKKLAALLDDNGFKDTYDFLYLPLDSGTHCSVGYAFVNFELPDTATAFKEQMCGYAFPGVSDSKNDLRKRTMHISIAHLQGVRANLEHLSRSAVLSSMSADSRPWFRELEQTLGQGDEVEEEFLWQPHQWWEPDESSLLQTDLPDEKYLEWVTPPPGFYFSMPDELEDWTPAQTSAAAEPFCTTSLALEASWQLPSSKPHAEVSETLAWLTRGSVGLLEEEVPLLARLTSQHVLTLLALILSFVLPSDHSQEMAALHWPHQVSLLPRWSRYFNFFVVSSAGRLATVLSHPDSNASCHICEAESPEDQDDAMPPLIGRTPCQSAAVSSSSLSQPLPGLSYALLEQALAPSPAALLVQALASEDSSSTTASESGLGCGQGLDHGPRHDVNTDVVRSHLERMCLETDSKPLRAKDWLGGLETEPHQSRTRAGREGRPCQPIGPPSKVRQRCS